MCLIFFFAIKKSVIKYEFMRQPYGSSGNFLCGGFNNLDYLWVIRLTNAFYQINTLSISCYVMSQKGVCYFSRKMIVILHKILFNGSISDHKKYFLWLFFPEFNMCRRLLRQARSCVWYTASFMTKCACYTLTVFVPHCPKLISQLSDFYTFWKVKRAIYFWKT